MILTGTMFAQVRLLLPFTYNHTLIIPNSCCRTAHIPPQRGRHRRFDKTPWWPQQARQSSFTPRRLLRLRAAKDLPIIGEDWRARKIGKWGP